MKYRLEALVYAYAYAVLGARKAIKILIQECT